MSESKFTTGDLRATGNAVHLWRHGIGMCVALAYDPDAAVGKGVPEVAQANARLFAASPEMHDLLTGRYWLVWSNEHKAWWGPNRSQYYWRIEAAGRYTLEEAIEISGMRLVERGDGINPPEMIQPSPEWLAGRVAALAKVAGESK